MRLFGKCPEVYHPDLAKFGLDEASYVATIRSINAILEPHNEHEAMQAEEASKAGQPSAAQAVRPCVCMCEGKKRGGGRMAGCRV